MTGTVVLRVEDPRWRIDGDPRPILRRAIRVAMREAGADGHGEVGVLLADDASVRALNARWRGKDRATNVLSFPAGPASDMLGDIVLAFETVSSEARADGKTLHDHLAHLVVHGALHLAGFDHESDADAERMEAAERRALARIGVADPYAARESAMAMRP